MNKLRGYIKECFGTMYTEDVYWKALGIAFVLVLLAPIVVPTRILYKVFKAVTREGI